MSDTITRVKAGDKEIILIGTAHISEESVKEVDAVIREEMPDNICIELDQSRYKAVTEKNSWSSLNIGEVLKQGKGFFLLANLVLSSFQKRLGLEIGTKPGEEMIRAVNLAKELDIPFTLCDREIQITLRRAWSRTGLWGKNKILAVMLSSVFSKEKLTEEDLEKLKKKSALGNMLEEISDFLPAVKSVLIDERDRFLATNIFNAKGKKIVAVVGAGHVPGIVNIIEELKTEKLSADLSDINIVPPKGIISKVIPWLIPALIIGIIGFGFYLGGTQKGTNMVWIWLLINGGLSALGALIALAHPLTILTAFIAAPITSLNPLVAAGFVTGMLEYKLRKPKVNDFEQLSTDLTSVKGFYKNRVTRILLVFFFSSLGSSIGTFIGISSITAMTAV